MRVFAYLILTTPPPLMVSIVFLTAYMAIGIPAHMIRGALARDIFRYDGWCLRAAPLSDTRAGLPGRHPGPASMIARETLFTADHAVSPQ